MSSWKLKRGAFVGLVGAWLLTGCKSLQPVQDAAKPTEPAAVPSDPTEHAPAQADQLQTAEASSTGNSADTMAPNLIAWDALAKEYRAKPGEESAAFVFGLTNISSEVIVIYATSTSCGCTVAQLPETPWKLSPGADGQISATMNLQGRQGANTKEIIVFTSKGNRSLSVTAILPDSPLPGM